MNSQGIISFHLQIYLIVASITVYLFVIYKIRKSNVRIDDMIIWIIGSITLLILSVFPLISDSLSHIIGFKSAANLIFTGILGFLFIMVFILSIKISQQHEKLKELTHKIAILERELSIEDSNINR